MAPGRVLKLELESRIPNHDVCLVATANANSFRSLHLTQHNIQTYMHLPPKKVLAIRSSTPCRRAAQSSLVVGGSEEIGDDAERAPERSAAPLSGGHC